MPAALDDRLERILGARVLRRSPLSGGCIGELHRVELADGRQAAVKVDPSAAPRLDTEAFMLRYLKAHAPVRVAAAVPELFHAEPNLLVMEFRPGRAVRTAAAEADLGEALAELHGVTAPQFGFERETLIGGLPQPNPWTPKWVDFFRDQRLLFMAWAAHREAVLPDAFLARLETFSTRLESLLPEPARPVLLHGDAWSGNVLADETQVTGWLDPALYYGDPEIELAFTTLFHSFGDRLYSRYAELRPIPREFWTVRKDIYNLYPLLVHLRLFGASYLNQIEGILRRFL